jgi:hypothetical protein
VPFDARANIDLEKAAPDVLAFDALAVYYYEIGIRRRALLLDAPEREALSQVLVGDRVVAFDPDRLEPFLPRSVNGFLAATGREEECRESVRERPGVRSDHGYLDG